MFFDSFESLWLMAGHGGYVWACYGLFITLLLANVWRARKQRKKALKQVSAVLRRKV